ncbi:MAG: VacJ family lipoprotein [Rhodobacteraceae bacterium]|nr:VacJ family lipoprotein [Paracoccaceae bacterium]
MHSRRGNFGRTCRALLVAAITLVVAACAQPDGFDTINDPHEVQNREVHAFNLSLDQRVLRPVAGTLGEGGTGPVGDGISNFASNLALPRAIVNNLLQFQLVDAMANTLRFSLNTTAGFGGLLDPAGAWGLHKRPGDFGGTLAAWGMAEGAYLELPFLGPSTERDALGMMVDLAIDPLNTLMAPRERAGSLALSVIDRVEDRSRFAGLVDSLLYESEDSYAQARLFYLQNRRRALQRGLADDDIEDIYDDF